MLYIYVVDLETTGLRGYKFGQVITEIAIYRVCVQTKKIEFIYEAIINPLTYENLSNNWTSAWIFTHGGYNEFELVEKGRPFAEVKQEVKNILENNYVTSYNTKFDLDLYLMQEPWCLRIIPWRCIMKDIARRYNNGRLMKLSHAWEVFGERRKRLHWHSAKDDTYAAAYLLANFLI